MFRSAVFRRGHRPTIVLLLAYYPVDSTLFEVSPEIRCSGVRMCQVATVAMETTQLVLSQYNNFSSHQPKIE